jgi:SPP1 Gp6-like portal protein
MAAYLSGPLGSSSQRGDIPSQLNRMDSLRRRDYRDNLRFYYGFQWPAPRINQRRRRLVFNYAKTLIEKVTSYLMQGRTIVVVPDGDSRATRRRADKTAEYLRRIEDEQSLALLDFDNEIDCAILGDAAYKVTWDPSREEGSGYGGHGRIAVTAPDVTGLYAWWQPDNLANLWRVASQYALDNQQISDLYGLTLDQRQPSQKITEVWTAETFQLFIGAQKLRDEANPYGFIPLVIYPNLRKPHQFWGESDITNVRETVQELNRAFSQLSSILEVSGNPIAVLEGISEAKDIAVEPGAVWELPEGAKAYLLDLLSHGGMELHLKYIDLLYRTLHDLGESPRTAFGGSASPNIAALAMQLDLDPIIKKVRRKQLIRSAAYRRRAELILRLTDLYTGSHHWPCRLQIQWAPLMPQDRARDAETDALLVDRGIISRRTAAGREGVEDAEADLGRWLEENERIARSGGLPRTPLTVTQHEPEGAI